MVKKNKLYTVNKWNQPAFVDREHQNIFDGWYNSYLEKAQADKQANPWNYVDDKDLVSQYAQQSKNSLGISKADNPFSKMNLAGVGKAVGNIGLGLAGSLGNKAAKGLIGGDLHSGAGDAIADIGNTVGGALSAVPGVGTLAVPAVQLFTGAIGGLTNRIIGSNIDQQKVDEYNQQIDALNDQANALGSAKTNEDVLSNWNSVSLGNDVESVGEDGWFSSDAADTTEELRNKQAAARLTAINALGLAAENADDNQDAMVARSFISAFGGPLNNKKSNKMSRFGNMPLFMPQRFAFGGDMQTNGSDFSTGLSHISAGGSHEENPYEGIQLGTDENGTPNLVEENETVWNDYVFSNRILADEVTKQMFKLPKKKDITFADISKKLEKEIAERPNDPVSRAGFKAQMQTLEEQQERQKSEMEAERARAAFEALSPEEQTAIMQNAAQQEATTQQAAQEQAIAEQQAAMQQATPEELALAQQQMADGTQAALDQEAPMMAEGGHLYAEGSKIRRGVYKALGFHTDKEFLDWARKHKLRGDDKWEMNEDALKNLAEDDEAWQVLISDATFAEAIKDNPALVDAISRGYDFGAYKPLENRKATIKSISRGNWKATNGAGWLGSDDPAWLEATKGMSEEDIKKLSTEDVAKLMRATSSYKKGTEWLQNKDNALLYLNTLLNDADTPQVAKDYAAKFVQDGQWKNGFNYDYATVFGSNGKGVRETNPGTYWHTPVEATRGAQAQNWVINDDGSVEEIIGEVPTDWTAAGNYSWATPENDMTYNYYRRPSAVASTSPKTQVAKTPEEDGFDIEPVRKAEWMRYAGLFGPAVGLGMQMAGVGRPDTAQLDAAISNSGDVALADWKPIGNYLTYRPMDIWYEQNALNAQSRATDRALLNSTSPSRAAGLLANSYNSQIASGNLYRNALEYNDNLRHKVSDFNRGTDQFNAEAYNRNSQFNADVRNRSKQFNAQMRLSAAREKMAADAGWYNSLYGNVAGLFKGIGDLGTENYRMNRIAEMGADGIFGNLGDSYTGSKYVRSNSKGGKLNKKKKGLTI